MALTAAQITARDGKVCLYCSGTFFRRVQETPYDFGRKKTCNRVCGNLWMNRQRWRGYSSREHTSARFHAKVFPEPMSGCWLWIGARVPDGYGSFSIATRKTIKAHRMAWLLYRGEIPEDAQVLHSCDNPSCVNPDHLFLGTNKSNVDDKMAKGRWGGSCGEAHPCTKLTNNDAIAIFHDKRPTRDISTEHGVPKYIVQRIRSGQTWRSVTGAEQC